MGISYLFTIDELYTIAIVQKSGAKAERNLPLPGKSIDTEKAIGSLIRKSYARKTEEGYVFDRVIYELVRKLLDAELVFEDSEGTRVYEAPGLALILEKDLHAPEGYCLKPAENIKAAEKELGISPGKGERADG